MKSDDLEYYKKLIIQKRKQILETYNFTYWFSNKINGDPNEDGEHGDNSHCLNGEKESSYNENDIHLKAKILQYLFILDHALIQVRKGKCGNYKNNIEEILKSLIEEFPNKQEFPKTER